MKPLKHTHTTAFMSYTGVFFKWNLTFIFINSR